MNSQIQQQVKNIYQLLFEMAAGNFTLRLQPDTDSKELDELADLLNSAAEKMELLIAALGYIKPHYTYQGLVQFTIILDKTFAIKSFSGHVPILLQYSADKLLEFSFGQIVAKQSIPLWDAVKAETASDPNAPAVVQFIFITSNQQLVPSYCTVSRLLYSNDIIINSITTVLQDMMPETTANLNMALHHQSDTVLIQNVREYILQNLENQLPTTSELSKIFNVNEFKLKDTFRHFFHTSIYQFYTGERLKKAHLLILQTSIPLKEIAFISGYNDYTNFYKAFKKRFSYPPSDLKRENGEDNNTV
ncbi:AraC-like DNA-binding protein [Flavobacterium sp. 1]|uniref:AraC family transcriptional regulator n=1 Tax=Flavobacterium sp. 1 TaxID=2035200 RepID=UPI000C2350D9|nr:AraC family transcriptional regulator [Flavobacterium sp. 1]PJJ07618.1 AraC-like DNA-binding protein [Flavobacterium sp. 1]